MAVTKLTKRAIERLTVPHPSGKQTLIWDADLKGFGVLLSGKTASKTYIVQRKLPGGLTRRVTIGACNALGLEGPDGARARAKKVLGQFYADIDPNAERRATAKRNRTLREAMEAYIADNKQIAERSRADYRSVIQNYLTAWLDAPIREITAEAVLKRHAAIAAEVARRNKGQRRGGGPATGHATADGVMRALRAVWYHQVEIDPTMPPNPVKMKKKGWFRVKPRQSSVPRTDLPAFYTAVEALPNRAHRDFLLLLLFTGLRRGEAAALRWDEVKLQDRVIKLPEDRTKTKRPLDLPMSDFVHDLLVARRAIGKEGPFVFAANSKSRHIEEPRFALAQVAKACGVIVTAHDLRRSFVSAANGTVSGRDARALVNHAVCGNVHDDYDMVTAEELREPAQRVADRLKELCGIAAQPPAGNVERIANDEAATREARS
jgi:integrase